MNETLALARLDAPVFGVGSICLKGLLYDQEEGRVFEYNYAMDGTIIFSPDGVYAFKPADKRDEVFLISPFSVEHVRIDRGHRVVTSLEGDAESKVFFASLTVRDGQEETIMVLKTQ